MSFFLGHVKKESVTKMQKMKNYAPFNGKLTFFAFYLILGDYSKVNSIIFKSEFRGSS